MSDAVIKPISEYISAVLGTLASIFLLLGAIIIFQDSSSEDIVSFIFVFFHLLAILLAVPFMLKGLTREAPLVWFYKTIYVLAGMNALFLVLIGIGFRQQTGDNSAPFVFAIGGFLEILPILIHKSASGKNDDLATEL